ncbi:hypothetical protein [Faecalitalea cylindroides]|jgi:hypothetical protein|uniref:hypothetical protein n=1 Tax=Faecalitalea cylindroides TaxID=39483 RepID=UPI002E79BF60|nr:hypothetical protein [Faecalitalea cylindroides]MEE1448559.1 hypothetical protein [Faecalitalea cylindroides]
MYVNYSYYLDTYLVVREPLIEEKDFYYWEKQAERELDHVTFDRVRKDKSLINESVMDCICELTEYLFKQSEYVQAISSDGIEGNLASYSNDGESASFDLSGKKEMYSESSKSSRIYGIISKYLSRTGLMYRGL